MKRIAKSTIFASLALVSLIAFSGSALAGHTASQLSDAGFTCFTAGPFNWTHCVDFDKLVEGKPAVSAKVFSEDGSQFFGTEQILRQDLYEKSWHPCPQDQLDVWDLDSDIPYYECHHFLRPPLP